MTTGMISRDKMLSILWTKLRGGALTCLKVLDKELRFKNKELSWEVFWKQFKGRFQGVDYDSFCNNLTDYQFEWCSSTQPWQLIQKIKSFLPMIKEGKHCNLGAWKPPTGNIPGHHIKLWVDSKLPVHVQKEVSKHLTLWHATLAELSNLLTKLWESEFGGPKPHRAVHQVEEHKYAEDDSNCEVEAIRQTESLSPKPKGEFGSVPRLNQAPQTTALTLALDHLDHLSVTSARGQVTLLRTVPIARKRLAKGTTPKGAKRR